MVLREQRQINAFAQPGRTGLDGVGLLALSKAGGYGIRLYESVNNTSVHGEEQAETMTISAGAVGGDETKTSR